MAAEVSTGQCVACAHFVSRRGRSAWPLAGLSGLVLWLSFFPADCGCLAWIALVPWLWVLRTGSGRVLLASFTAGLVFGLLAVQWVRLADPKMYFAWWALALLLALHWWLVALAIRSLVYKLGYPLPLVAPVFWTAAEFLRGNLDIGFSWYFLAHTQHHVLPYLGLVSVTGAYGISALVMLVNALVTEWLVRFAQRLASPTNRSSEIGMPILSRKALVCWSLVGLVWFAINPLLVWYWYREYTPFGRIRVLIAQANEPQAIRNLPSEERWKEFIASFKALVNQLRQSLHRQGPVDLVVWPETAMPFDWVSVHPLSKNGDSASNQFVARRSWQTMSSEDLRALQDEQAEMFTALQELARLLPTSQVQGVNARIYWLADSQPQQDNSVRYRLVRYNSALLVDQRGRVRERYDKIYCIPFGEYIPLRDRFPWMEYLSPYSYDYSVAPGQQAKLFHLEDSKARFGVLICYEDTVPHFPRQFFSEQCPDFFVNISNDGWFHGSEEHEQHLAIARFRAAETRRALVRSVNMGISAVVDADGTVLALPGESWRTSKARSAALVGEVPLYQGRTVYVRFGDWFAGMCLGLAGLNLFAAGWRVCFQRQSMAAGSG